MIIRNVDCVIERRLRELQGETRSGRSSPARRFSTSTSGRSGRRRHLSDPTWSAGRTASPGTLGMTTENVAHRFAVEWDEGGVTRSGVYVPRRDSSSGVSALAGGRLFPGSHLRATIRVRESERDVNISVHNHKRPMSTR